MTKKPFIITIPNSNADARILEIVSWFKQRKSDTVMDEIFVFSKGSQDPQICSTKVGNILPVNQIVSCVDLEDEFIFQKREFRCDAQTNQSNK